MTGIPSNYILKNGEYFHPSDKRLHETNDNRKIPNPVTQCNHAPTLGRADEGKEKRMDRITVRFIGSRVKPLDPDNFAGSIKNLLDGLRHANIISGDENWRIKLETEQTKVAHYADEKTVIEIDGA